MRIRKREIFLLIINTLLSIVNLYFSVIGDFRSSNVILTIMYAILILVLILIMVDNDGYIK